VTTSPEYQRLLRELHDREVSFGGGSHVLTVAQVIRTLNIRSISDYGAGKMLLEKVLKKEFDLQFSYYPYDPAFPEYGPPVPADLVCCIEVLEHVEPNLIEVVLEQLADITVKWGFFTVHCSNSSKFLADGRNAHILQRPISWWLTKLSDHFDIQWLNKTGPDSFAVIATRLGNSEFRLSGLQLYTRDSIKQHFGSFAGALKLEVARRVRRGKWRP
jgi:hypothetical protein